MLDDSARGYSACSAMDHPLPPSVYVGRQRLSAARQGICEADAVALEARQRHALNCQRSVRMRRETRRPLIVSANGEEDIVPASPEQIGTSSAAMPRENTERLLSAYTSAYKGRMVSEMERRLSTTQLSTPAGFGKRIGGIPVLSLYESERLLDQVERMADWRWPSTAATTRARPATVLVPRRQKPWSSRPTSTVPWAELK